MREAKTRKYHSPEFKAKVGLEAVRGVKTLTRLASGRAHEKGKTGQIPRFLRSTVEIGLFFIIVIATRLAKVGCSEIPIVEMLQDFGVSHVNGEAAGLMRVSIIIPCWNRQDYIEDAISSALRQTYSDVEIVVVDDGSTDRTVEAVRQYGADVKLVQQPNRGVSSARNTGIRNSSGAIYYFPRSG